VVSVTYNFQTGNNKIKQLTQYESVTQKSFIWQRYDRRIDVLIDQFTLSYYVSSFISLLPI
jgi:hypothetical protein